MARRRKHSSRSHARHTTALATRPNVVVVRSGGGGRRRRAARVVVRGARRAARSVARHALPVTGLGLGGAALGWLQSEGHLEAVPAIAGSKMIGLGVLGYFATRMTKNKYIREAGAAAVAIAGFQFGQSHGGGGGRPAVHGPFQAGMGWGAGG